MIFGPEFDIEIWSISNQNFPSNGLPNLDVDIWSKFHLREKKKTFFRAHTCIKNQLGNLVDFR